jgi:hypothetical protein
LFYEVGPDISVDIATSYGLDDPGIECPRGRHFFGPLQIDLRAHTTSCKIGKGALSQGKSGRDVALTTHLHLTPMLKKK